MKHPITILLFWGILLCLFTGCRNSERVPSGEPVPQEPVAVRQEAIPERESEPEITPLDSSAYSCRMLFTFPGSLKQIRANPRRIIDGEDGCTFALCDSLASRWVQRGERRYLETLESIAEISDGCLAEYMEGVSGDLYRERPRDYVNFLYRHGKTVVLRQFLVWSLQWRSDASDPHSDEWEDLAATTDSLMKALPAGERRFLREILEESKFEVPSEAREQ